MKPLLFDVKSLLKNSSIYLKEIKEGPLNDQFHFHNAYEIALIIQGKGRRIVGDDVSQFQNGDLILLSPNLPHASYSDEKYHVEKNSNIHALVIYFQPDWIAEHHLNSIDFAPFKDLLDRLERGIEITGKTSKNVKKNLLKLRNTDGFKSYIILQNILCDIAYSEEYRYLASSRYSNKHNANDIKKINEVYKYVMQNFTEKILLEQVAAVAYMTPSAFCKYFKTKTNKTFTHFVNEIRIGYACELLRNENLDIAEVCFRCGFNNFTSFNKNFKLFAGNTPTEYRFKILSSR